MHVGFEGEINGRTIYHHTFERCGAATVTIFSHLADPTDLDALRDAIANAPDAGELTSLDLAVLTISAAATDSLVEVITALLPESTTARAHVFVLVDSTRIERAGRDLKADVATMLEHAFSVTTVVLGDNHHLQADDTAIDTATESLAGADCVVTIGGGTITDIGKVASHRLGNIPLVVVQTAASVDGFTDNVSVLLRNGVKRTEPSRWPDAVLADTVTIAEAPIAMNKAGFGEVLSLYTAPADWELAYLLGHDASFNRTPRDFLLEFAGDPSEWAAGIQSQDPQSVGHLTRVLAIRGIGTGIAGSTACLSGVEHLISHMLDMYATSHDEEMGFHGAQVGVASVVASTIWQYFSERLADGLDEVSFPEAASLEAQVRSAFAWCDPSGEKGAECWNDFSAKLAVWNSNRSRILEVLGRWNASHGEIARAIPSPESLATNLRAAGAPADPSALGEWVREDVWHWAIKNTNFMRNRLTIVDVLFFLGWWTDADVAGIIARARVSSAGLLDVR